MGKQSKTTSKRQESSTGKGKVTPVQIAFIVDRYLSDHNFSQTRSVFRNEASSLISKSPLREAPKSLLSLEAMLNEYISLKEQRVILDQERERLDHEKLRLQSLLQGMQDVMNAYNASGSGINAAATNKSAVVSGSQPELPLTESSAGCATTSNGQLVVPSTRKRGYSSIAVDANKKSRNKLPIKRMQSQTESITQKTTISSPIVGSSPMVCGELVQGAAVAKSLFNLSLLPPSHSPSPSPNTPPQQVVMVSENDKQATPAVVPSSANCSNYSTPHGMITPANCTVITTERVTVSPCKDAAFYTIERSRCISSSSPIKTPSRRTGKRDCVKGRLDFGRSDTVASIDTDKPIVDEASTSESEKEKDILDFPNLDLFGPEFSFSDLLGDFDFDCHEIDYPCLPTSGLSEDTSPGSSPESGDGQTVGADEVVSEFSSTLTEVISGKDVNIQAPETVTSMKSITKRITILSPAKAHRSSFSHVDSLEKIRRA